MTEPTCKNCGMCCHTTILGRITSCKHLKDLGNGKTTCTIFSHRLRTVIAINRKTKQLARCNMRVDGEYDYPGCEFNTGKPCFIEHCKEVMNNV